MQAHLLQFREQHLHVLRPGTCYLNFATGHADCRHVGGGLDPIRHNGVFHCLQPLDALDRDRGGTGTRHMAAHSVQEGSQVGDLGFAGSVVDHRRTPGKNRCHQQVLSGTDTRIRQENRCSHKAVGTTLDVAVDRGERSAQFLETPKVHVDRAVAKVVAAGNRDPGGSEAAQQGTQHHNGGPHPLDQLVGRLRSDRLGDVNGDHVSLLGNGDAHLLKQFTHPPDVGDLGYATQREPARCQQGGRHQLERRVLGTRDPHSPGQRPGLPDTNEGWPVNRGGAIHHLSMLRPRPDRKATPSTSQLTTSWWNTSWTMTGWPNCAPGATTWSERPTSATTSSASQTDRSSTTNAPSRSSATVPTTG